MFGISTKEGKQFDLSIYIWSLLTMALDDDVRVIMYPKPKPEDDTEKVKRQYILSHNLYSPGN